MDTKPGIQKNAAGLSKKDFIIPVLLLLFAFSIRFTYLNQVKTGPLFTPTEATIDEHLYDSWAKEIAFKDPIGKEAFWGLPLYPYFLGLIYFLFGPNVYIARFIQFLIGSINCVLLYFIGKKIFNKPIGVIAGLLLSLYSASIFYEGFLVSSAISMFLTCCLILLILSFDQNPNYKKSVFLGITLGLAALATPSIFLFMLFFILWGLRNLKHTLVAVFLCTAVIGLVTIRNYILEKDFIPITAHNGINFYAGNNPDSKGTFSLPYYLGTDPITIKQNSKAIAEKYMKKKLKPSQASRFWFQKGITFIKENPASYAGLLLKRFALFWNYYEISDLCDITFFKRFAPILKLPFVNYAVISIFSILGIFLSFKNKKRNYILLQLFILSALISLMLYFINTRYRLPAVPVLILFASYGMYTIYRLLLEKKRKALLYCVIGLAISYFFVTLRLIRASPENSYNNLGNIYMCKEMYNEALEEFKKAAELNPDYPAIHNNLGMLYRKLGRFDDAIRECKIAIDLLPDYANAHNNLGILYKKVGRFDDAIREYKIAAEINPGLTNPYYNLGLLYFELGRYDEAIENFKKILEITPDSSEARQKIALCREAAGG